VNLVLRFVAPAPAFARIARVFGLLRADAVAARMAAWAALFFGPWTARQAAGMCIGVAIFFVGMGALLLVGALGQPSIPNLLPLAIVVLCLGLLLAGIGVAWFRRAGPPGRELAKGFQ
jgi:hypothetical protein